MRKLKGKLSRALSLVLVAAMVMGMTPDVCLVSYAAEQKEEIVAEAEPTAGDEQVVEAEPVVEVEPVEEEKPVVESSVAEESTPIEESDVVVETTSVEENSTVVQSIVVEESIPVEESGVEIETTSVEESSTVVEPITVEEITTVEETETLEAQNFDFLDGEGATYFTVTEVTSNADILYEDDCVTSESKVMEGTDIKFSVARYYGYRIVAVYSETTSGREELTPVDGVYTIENSKITADITICVETEKETYQISTQIEGAEAENVAITFLNKCVEEGKVDFDKTVQFRVAVKDEDKNYITSVGYKQGESEQSNPLTADENEVYTIENLTGDITIVVTTAEYKYVKVSPVYLISGSEVEYDKLLDGMGFEYVSGNYSNPRTGERITFKVVSDVSRYMIEKVIYNDEELLVEDGLYTITVAEGAEKIVMLFKPVTSSGVKFDYESAEATVTGAEYAVINEAYTFTVVPAREYHYEIKSVNAYAVAEGEMPCEENKLTLSVAGDNYTIAAEDVVADKSIYVEVLTGLECYEVTFDIGEGVTVKIGETELTAESTIEESKIEAYYNERITFTANAGEKKISTNAIGNYSGNGIVDYYVDVTEDATVSVVAEEYGNATVHLNYVEEYVKDVKLLYKNQPIAITDKTAIVPEQYYDDLTLDITPAKGYAIRRVEASNNAHLQWKKGSVYSMSIMSDNQEIDLSIYPVITDKKDIYNIEFQMDRNACGISYGVEVDKVCDFRTITDKYCTIVTDKPGEFEFGLYISPGYTLKSVTYEGVPLEGEGSYYLTINENVKKYIVKIETEVVENESSKIVTINNKTNNTSYKLLSGVKKVDNKTKTVELEAGNNVFTFEVTTDQYTEAVVTYVDKNGILSTLYEKTRRIEKNNYVHYYSIPTAYLADQSVIEIDAVVNEVSLMFSFNPEELDLEYVTCDGVAIENIGYPSYYNYMMKANQTVSFKAKVKENCKLTDAFILSKGKIKIKGNTVEYTGKITDSMKVGIETIALHTNNPLLDKSDNAVTAVKNVYSVTAGQTYAATIRSGVAGTAKMKSVQVTDSKKKVTSEIRVNFYPGYQKADIVVPQAAAGKKYTVTFTSENGTKVVYTLDVFPEPSKITVTGVKNGVLEQASDTIKEYKLAITPKNVDINDIGIKVESRYGVSARITEKGMLAVTVPAGVPVNEVAKIKFYIKSKSADTTCYIDAKNGGEFTVKRTAPTTVTKLTPSVSLNSSSDIVLSLKLGSNFTDTLATGKLWYKVEIAAQGKDAPAVMNPVTYIPREGASQTVDIQVIEGNIGQGKACKYDVKVTLLQTKDTATLTQGNEAIKTSAVSKTKLTKNLATKNPYYETNLTMKKGATTVYTGQKNVLVGTATYSKNTTYTSEVTLHNYSSALNPVVIGNQIFVSPNDDATPGKHTVTVRATTPYDTYGSTATVTVNVVKGINEISINASCYEIYKAYNKSATQKLSVQWDTGSYWTELKTNKLIWSIVDENGNPLKKSDNMYGKVTVKNGTITVAKDYVVSDQSKFWVKAEAADFKGNDAYDITGPFTITGECLEIDELVLAREEGEDGYHVIARNNQTITLDECVGYTYLLAVKKGVEEKDFYTSDEVWDWDDYDKVNYTTNTCKIMDFLRNGVFIFDAGKNIVFTATTRDGGNRKLTLKMNVAYKPTEELDITEIRMYEKSDSTSYVSATRNDSAFTINGITNEQVLDVLLSEDYTDCKITVNSGGKVINSDIWSKKILMTAKTTTFTLQYTSSITQKKVSKKYTVTNENYRTVVGPSVKTSDKLYSSARQDQTVTYKLSGAYNYAGKYVFVVADEFEKAKNRKYNILEIYSKNLEEAIAINEDGTFSLVFGPDDYMVDTFYVDKGNYNLKMTFGALVGGIFIPETKPTNVTLRVEDHPRTTYKPYQITSTYKMSMRDGASVPFTYTDKKAPTRPTVTQLLNANINGQPNKFREYFEVDISTNSLKIKDGITQEQLSQINKNDLIGYIPGTVMSSYVKITVTLVDTLNKYTTYATNTAPDDDMYSEVAVCVGKEVVGIKAAYVTGTKGANAKVTGTFKANAVNENGSVTLHSSDATLGIHTVTMYVIPETSGYWSQISTLTGDDLNKAIQKYGVKVTATVKVTNTEPLG